MMKAGHLPSSDITLCAGLRAETDCSTQAGVPLKLMSSKSLYSEELWKAYSEKIIRQRNRKTYRHFDDPFDFDASGEMVRRLVADPTFKLVAKHSFAPLLKILTKTPRYRYDEENEVFGLETKIRPISFAGHFDSYLYGFYAYALTIAYQDYIKTMGFDHCVLAYRSDLGGDCNIQFAGRAFGHIDEMVAKYGRCTVIALDIKGYFDTINHRLLKEKWAKVLGVGELPLDQYRIFRSLTAYSYVNKASLLKHFDIKISKADQHKNLLSLIPDYIGGTSYKAKFDLLRRRKLIVSNHNRKGPSEKGIPQGSPLSSVLSNIYLIDFDKWLTTMGRLMDFRYLRYCDDLLVICQSKDANYLLDKIREEIDEEYLLKIQAKKSEVIEFRENSVGKVRAFDIKHPAIRDTDEGNERRYYKNLQYLGFEYNGQHTYIRPGSLSKYFRKAKGRILKTLMMAYGKRSKSEQIYKRRILELYSHFGRRNFITYAHNAGKATYMNSLGKERKGLDSPSIRRQLAGHFSFLNRELSAMSAQFARHKGVTQKK